MDKKTILVADDEKEYCDFINGYFSERGYVVDVAYDGLQAKFQLEEKKYDFVIFDYNMPELSGIELLKVINRHNPQARKIMVSGYDCLTEKFAKAVGADIFLPKPVTLGDLRKIFIE